MWFNRKQKNRRLSRVHVLDVKLRSDQVRQSRRRWGGLAVGVVLGTGFGLYLLWRAGDWALNRMVYENPAFAIREVEVQTDGVIAERELRRLTGVRSGENLFALDLVRVERDLKQNPFIATVSIERILPKTLRVRVREREAVAQVNVPVPRTGGGTNQPAFHLAADGLIMRPMDPRQRAPASRPADDSLPWLTGINPANLQLGRRLDSVQVAAGLQLISEFASSPMAGQVDLRRIDVSAADVLVVTTVSGSEVTFALQDLGWQLRRWRAIYDEGQRRKCNLVSLDLAVSNNIPARFTEASALPVPAPKPPRPLPSKKRHV